MFKDIQIQHERIGLPYDSDEQVKMYLFELCAFLNVHGFAHIDLPSSAEGVQTDFVLRVSHLTEDGKSFIRSVLNKWTKARCKNALAVLKRALTKFREN